MKEIKLTKGFTTLVDDEDYDIFSKWKWKYHYQGYACRTGKVNGKYVNYYLHRVIIDAKKGQQVDHKNRNRLDNRRENLRIATSTQNNINSSPRRNSSSKYKGVNWHLDGRWKVSIQVAGKTIGVGWMLSEIEAAKAYDSAALYYHGEEFAYLNFPELIEYYKTDPYFEKKCLKSVFGIAKTSKYRGVSKFKRDSTWTVQVSLDNKSIKLGKFQDELEAAKYYDKYIIENNLLFRRKLNFPIEDYI